MNTFSFVTFAFTSRKTTLHGGLGRVNKSGRPGPPLKVYHCCVIVSIFGRFLLF